MKLGSLFDGSGGFPLAGSLCGIEPVRAAEVETYPIAVTSSRFPNVKHLGSVTDIHGGKIEPVDIITFGSPCQDLSVAGKRAGLKHEANGDEETTRSGLFVEAVRIINEMREATDGRYPTFAVWENVPGAFSSNQGEDFRIVLEELIKIVEPGAAMPAVPKGGWAYADYYRGDGWSLGYRVLDAQYWGVPQRRRRIYLVADFRGQRVRKILFERKGLRGHLAESGETRQAAAAYAERGAGADDRKGNGSCLGFHLLQDPITCEELAPCLSQGSSDRGQAAIGVAYGQPIAIDRAAFNQGQNAQYEPQYYEDGTVATLVARGPSAVAYSETYQKVTGPLMANSHPGSYTGQDAYNDMFVVGKENIRYIVRRLTPTECARLQGFPDHWGHPDYKEDFTDEEWTFWEGVRNTHAAINGKATKSYTREQMVKWYNGLHTDSAEYKMWGNGIALPCARYVMEGIAEVARGELME